MHSRADFRSNFWEVLGVLKQTSKKLPQNVLRLEISQGSYPAEVRKWNISPFFSAKGVVKFGVKFMWNFPCYVFQDLGVRRKISPKFHVKNGVKNGKFHADFTLLGHSAEISTSRYSVWRFPHQGNFWGSSGATPENSSSPTGKRSENGGVGIAPNCPCWDTKNPIALRIIQAIFGL